MVSLQPGHGREQCFCKAVRQYLPWKGMTMCEIPRALHVVTVSVWYTLCCLHERGSGMQLRSHSNCKVKLEALTSSNTRPSHCPVSLAWESRGWVAWDMGCYPGFQPPGMWWFLLAASVGGFSGSSLKLQPLLASARQMYPPYWNKLPFLSLPLSFLKRQIWQKWEKDFPYTGSLPRWPQWLERSSFEARS